MGVKWRIGNGKTTKFWEDIWTDFGKLANHFSGNGIMDVTLSVCDFWDNFSWDLDKLSSCLPPEIVNEIYAIPIAAYDEEDKIIWNATSHGNFSVSSAYMLNFTEDVSVVHPWASIWKLDIPPKLRIFLWSVVSGKLMTNVQRAHRKFITDSSCPHCPGEPESLLHMFRDCPKAKIIWNSIYVPYSMQATAKLDWESWLFANMLQKRCKSQEVSWNIFFSFVCWFIWKWRCKFSFDSSFKLPFDVASVIHSYIEDWVKANAKRNDRPVRQASLLHWIKPPQGVCKVNVDGARKSCGAIGAGGVVRDSLGAWKGGFMANMGVGDVIQAETWGFFYGLQLAMQKGMTNIEVESDNAALIKVVQEADISVHPLGTILKKCRMLIKGFESCRIAHIHRERNRVADLLAKESLNLEKGMLLLDSVPQAAVGAVLDDIAAVARMRFIPISNYDCSASKAG